MPARQQHATMLLTTILTTIPVPAEDFDPEYERHTPAADAAAGVAGTEKRMQKSAFSLPEDPQLCALLKEHLLKLLQLKGKHSATDAYTTAVLGWVRELPPGLLQHLPSSHPQLLTALSERGVAFDTCYVYPVCSCGWVWR